MEGPIEPWVEFAKRDLAAARVLVPAGSYLQVGFVCQQAIEKLLKALFLAQKGALAPKTHDLGKLVMLVDLQPAERDRRVPFLVELTDLCTRARYPDPNWVETLRQLDRRATAERLLAGTEEAFSWLEAMLTSG